MVAMIKGYFDGLVGNNGNFNADALNLNTVLC